MRTPRIAPALIAVLTVGLAACGSDSDDAGESVVSAAPTTTSAAVTTVATETSDAATTTEAPDTTEAVTTTEAATTTQAPETTAAADTTATPDTTAAPDTTVTDTTEAPSVGTVIDVMTADGRFTTLLAAIEAAGLTETAATNPATLLAPTDEAFAALGQPAIDALLADPVALEALLRDHLLPIPQDVRTISIFKNIVAVTGRSYDVVITGDTITIGGAAVVAPDLAADDGVVHGVDTVLVAAPAT